MKRAALCFSGQMRNVKRGFDHIHPNIIEPNLSDWNFDVFVHTWFDKNDIGKNFVAANGTIASECLDGSVIDSIYERYNPVSFLSEKQKEFDEKDYNNRKSDLIKPKFSLSKNYSMNKVGKSLMDFEYENNITYDAVVSLRFDLGVQTKIDLNQLNLDYINMPTHGVFNGEGVDVSHAFMSGKLFYEYCQFYNYIDLCFREHNVLFCDERLMHKYLDIKQLPYHRNSYLNNYFLIRT